MIPDMDESKDKSTGCLLKIASSWKAEEEAKLGLALCVVCQLGIKDFLQYEYGVRI